MTVNVAKDLMEINIIERMNLLEREVAGQGAKLDAIQESLRRLAQSVDRPTNWAGIGALIIASFTVCLTIMSLATSAVGEKANETSAQVNEITPIVYQSAEHIDRADDDIAEMKRDIKKLIAQAAKAEETKQE